MDTLLKWAILNGATIGEDAPPRDSAAPAPQPLDPQVLDAILGKPASVQMTECVDAAEDPHAAPDDRATALDNLEMLVEHIDNACNLQPLGLWPRLIALYRDAEPDVRTGALWVSGTAVQHNPKAQKSYSANGGMEAALRVLKDDASPAVRTKALYCVSSLIRANANGLTEFIASNGFPVLMLAIETGSSPLRQKAFFLLRSLIDEALDTVTPEDLRPGMSLPNAIAEIGFVDATATALDEMATSDKDTAAALAFEQAVGFLVALCATDSGKQAVTESAALRSALAAAEKVFDGVDTSALNALIA